MTNKISSVFTWETTSGCIPRSFTLNNATSSKSLFKAHGGHFNIVGSGRGLIGANVTLQSSIIFRTGRDLFPQSLCFFPFLFCVQACGFEQKLSFTVHTHSNIFCLCKRWTGYLQKKKHLCSLCYSSQS
jgi:hypothetical protein